MPSGPDADSLTSGLATSIGSLPHTDPRAAAELVLARHPALPAAPELPCRAREEGMILRSVRALPEVRLARDGTIHVDPALYDAPIRPALDDVAHAGTLAFLEAVVSRSQSQPRVKMQTAGPLTLGLALYDAGMPRARAFRRGAQLARAWATTLEDVVASRLPDTSLVLFFDEPGLVAWCGDDAPLDHEAAVDILSGALAATTCTTGVHACGATAHLLALEAGPRILGVDVRADLLADASAIGRHLEAGGWIAWGAVPTDRPVGDSCEPTWRSLVMLWCELTRRGCDPVLLRTQALVTPACGLAHHDVDRASHLLGLACEMAHRVHDHAVAARLTVGA